ncbi:hypothetical protein ZWY2020_010900 [Hordeum vulgare]|nr:hypothetical protein ZWY2020_010900 [Hordeum vulgare]
MHVVMFPWLAHDHINTYLEMAKHLIASASDHHHLDVIVHLVSMPANLVHHLADMIRLVELQLPTLADLTVPCFSVLLEKLTNHGPAPPDCLVY